MFWSVIDSQDFGQVMAAAVVMIRLGKAPKCLSGSHQMCSQRRENWSVKDPDTGTVTSLITLRPKF